MDGEYIMFPKIPVAPDTGDTKFTTEDERQSSGYIPKTPGDSLITYDILVQESESLRGG